MKTTKLKVTGLEESLTDENIKSPLGHSETYELEIEKTYTLGRNCNYHCSNIPLGKNNLLARRQGEIFITEEDAQRKIFYKNTGLIKPKLISKEPNQTERQNELVYNEPIEVYSGDTIHFPEIVSLQII